MSTDRDVTRIVRSWLKEDAHDDANRVLDLVLDQLDTTPQRRAAWPVRRIRSMNNAVRIGLATAAVVVVALLGIRFLVPSNTGSPGPTPTPVPTATSIPVPSPVVLNSTDIGMQLAAGRYAFEIGPPGSPRHFAVELTMKAGWVPQRLAEGEVTFAIQHLGGDGASLRFFSAGRVYRDPCHPEDGIAGEYLGISNARDLVTELRALVGFDAGSASTVRIGDLTATHFVLSNTIDAETAGCTDGQLLPLFMTSESDGSVEVETRTTHSPVVKAGTSQQVWIVDRNLYPLVIIGEAGALANPPEDLGTIMGILGSITLGN